MNKNSKHNIRTILLFVALFVIASVLMINSFFKSVAEGKEILEEISFDFHGEVIYKTVIDGGYGLVGLKLDSVSNNITKYDPRSSSSQYFCVISNDSAEVVLTSVLNTEIGDYFSFNSKSGNLTIRRGDSIISNEPPRFFSGVGKNKWLKDNHKL